MVVHIVHLSQPCVCCPPISGRRTHGYKIMEISLHESYLISRSPDSPSLPMPLHSHQRSRIMYVLVMQAYFLYSGCTPPPHDAAPQAAAGAEPHLTTPVKRRRQRRNWMKIRLGSVDDGCRLLLNEQRRAAGDREQTDRQTDRKRRRQTCTDKPPVIEIYIGLGSQQKKIAIYRETARQGGRLFPVGNRLHSHRFSLFSSPIAVSPIQAKDLRRRRRRRNKW